MTLRIYPAEKPYDDVYQTLLNAVLAGSQWLRAPIELPYTIYKTSFIVEANPGDVLKIYINNKLNYSFITSFNTNQIDLQLEYGRNFIQVKSSTENYLILVATSNWAIILNAFAREYYYNAGVRIEDTERQLTNFFSLRAVEHQIEFQDLLPPGRAERILEGKLAVKTMINETGSTRGVNEIVTSASNTTPIVVPTQVDTQYLDPTYDLYTTAHDFGGFEFNCWIPNKCIAVWAAFIKLINNNSNTNIIEASDIKVRLENGKNSAYIISSGLTNLTSFSGGETLNLSIDGSLFTVLFQSSDQTPTDIVNRINSYAYSAKLIEKVAWIVGNEIKISSLKQGSTSNVSIIGGTSLTTLGLIVENIYGKDGIEENHIFDFEVDACNVLGSLFEECFSKVRIWVSTYLESNIAFCLWTHPLDKTIAYHLESGLLDLGETFDDGGTFDSGDPSDPYGNGWIGTNITPELDSGLTFDTFFDVTLLEDLECLFNGPTVSSLESGLSEIDINFGNITITSTLKVTV